MPQLDSIHYLELITWFIITYTIFYLYFKTYFLYKINDWIVINSLMVKQLAEN